MYTMTLNWYGEEIQVDHDDGILDRVYVQGSDMTEELTPAQLEEIQELLDNRWRALVRHNELP